MVNHKLPVSLFLASDNFNAVSLHLNRFPIRSSSTQPPLSSQQDNVAGVESFDKQSMHVIWGDGKPSRANESGWQ